MHNLLSLFSCYIFQFSPSFQSADFMLRWGTSLCRCSSLSEARKVFVYVNGGTDAAVDAYRKVIPNNINWMNINLFNIEYVLETIFSCGKVSYNLFIYCCCKVELTFKGATFHLNGIRICLLYDFEVLRFYWYAK